MTTQASRPLWPSPSLVLVTSANDAVDDEDEVNDVNDGVDMGDVQIGVSERQEELPEVFQVTENEAGRPKRGRGLVRTVTQVTAKKSV